MPIRTGLGLLICCVVLAACTANAAKGPAATVTTPAVGHPPAPSSVAAAMSSEVFTPYAALGASDNDGLAPGDTYDALHTACMNDAGYGQYAADAPYPARTNSGLGFPQAFGPWGSVGTALAAEQGFLAGSGGPGPGGGASGPGSGTPGDPFSTLPTGAQQAAGKCFNILENFNNAQFAHSMSIIETLNNYISTDVIQDGEFKKATRDWSACMAKEGFSSADPSSFWQQALTALGQRPPPGQRTTGPPAPPTAAQNKQQIAMAVADANCTLSSDLAGIYFAVQASYEQQFVSANKQALDAGVREYKAAFAKALKTLPALLQTTSATPNLPRPPSPGHHAKPSRTAKPSPSHS
jgi:hypothetical protein